MSGDSTAPELLAGVRVLDLATPRAEIAGRLLADLGAEVIKIEPPAGAAARRLPPFSEQDGRSLYWAALGLGKRSVVLDLEGSADDRARLAELAAGADVLLESFDAGQMTAWGLGHAELSRRNAALVYASVTPYGQDGPWADRLATDLTVEAAGGLVGLQGDSDRPPIPVGYPQAAFHAGIQAAADVIVALHERERSGLGQHLDVSQQAAIVWTLMHATGFPPNTGGDPPGTGAQRAATPRPIASRIVPCADGYVVFGVAPAGLALRGVKHFLHWMQAEGALVGGWAERDLEAWAADLQALAARDLDAAMAEATEVADLVWSLIARRPKQELFEGAVRHDFMLAPLNSVADVLADPHLRARDYWVEVDGRIYPGPFAKFSRTPIRYRAAAPELGQDQALLDAPARRPDVRAPSGEPRRPAFDGIKVADFAWVGVGPLISKALADHGATVAHVESATRPDVLRLAPPFKDNEPGLDRAQFMANFNSSKLGLALNLATPEGVALARRLIDWADVVVESFTPGTLAKLGLDYETIRKDRPDLVMLSTCMRGQTGPDRTYAGFGLQGACLSGLHLITGWPDRPPAGTWGAYTDFINPRYGLAAIAAALWHRARTGEGQHIDQAQTEAGIHFLEPLILDYLENGRVAAAPGHASATACPHGVFQTRGEERYIALAVETREQWRALCSVAPLDVWKHDACDDLAERRAFKEPIEATLAAWCAGQDAWELAERLAAAGVPAAPVQRPSDLYQDAQLAQRGFFVTLNHSVMGPTPYDGHVTRFSATPAQLRKAAPCLGEDTQHVLRELLRVPEEEIALAAGAGALE